MFGKRTYKRSTFLPFAIFRLFLSLIIFVILLGGLYSALQYFSGVDPLKINPKAVTSLLLSSIQDPKNLLEQLSKMDLNALLGSEKNNLSKETNLQPGQSDAPLDKPVAFSFLLVADSHSENDYLQKALNQGKNHAKKLEFVIGLGDYTEVGTKEELTKAKQVFDSADLRYFLLVGDHDLWDARDKQSLPSADAEGKKLGAVANFVKVFGSAYQSFVHQNVKFILINNADNYLGLLDDQLEWLNSELKRAQDDNTNLVFVFLHEPIYHPSSTHTMGLVTTKLKDQAKTLVQTFKDGQVKELFSGDIHYFTRYQEPVTHLNMTTIGAAASAKNTQAPRYGVVTVYEDGTYGVEDVEIR